MRRVNLFLTLLIASVAALIASTLVGFTLFSSAQTQTPYGWMGQMWNPNSASTSSSYNGMGSMMGQTSTGAQASANGSLQYFGVLFAVLIAVVVIGVVGLSYYLVYPQIHVGAIPSAAGLATSAANGSGAFESVSKTLTVEERKVIEVLNAHQGKYLQKYIKSETGLSRLKTHRIIARLSERGIVTLEKTGNTNQVTLANWLTQKN